MWRVKLTPKLIFTIALLCSFIPSWAQMGTHGDASMGKALAIFEELFSFNATPLKQSFIERITGTRLIPPDEDYSPAVQKLLKDMGVGPQPKSRYVLDYAGINSEIQMKVHFADPVLSLSWGTEPAIQSPLPNPLTQESLTAYTQVAVAEFEAAIKRNCIEKNFIFSLLQRNGWALTQQPLSADPDATDGNFGFTRMKDFSTVTMARGCLVGVMIGSVHR